MSRCETEEMLGAYHDGELEMGRSLEVEAHLRECSACTAQLRKLAALSAAVRRAPYYQAPRPLGILPALPLRRAGRWPMVLLAAAACVAAFVFLGTSSHSGLPESDMVKEVVSAHVRSLQASHLLDVPSEDRHTVKPWFTGKLDFAPEVNPPPGFELLGGRLDYLDGRSVAALVYRYRQHTVNLFTWPARQPDEWPVAETLQGFHVVHWIRGGMNWWAVSDLAGDELRQMAK
jgi:anti-sigma factor RsiW